MAYVYIKDDEGFVVKKKKSEVLPNETIITKEEYAELSGDNYYKSKFRKLYYRIFLCRYK